MLHNLQKYGQEVVATVEGSAPLVSRVECQPHGVLGDNTLHVQTQMHTL